MQKLPEVSDKKKGWRMLEEKRTSSQKKEEANTLSDSDRRSDKTLLSGERRHAFVFGRSVGWSFHQ